MDESKKIAALLSENEFLQLQLEDLNATLKSRDNEIMILGDNMDSAAALQSRIDGNLLEIEQLNFEMSVTRRKTTAAEMINEELEISLLRETKEKHRRETELKKLSSVKIELDIISNELDESAPLYEKAAELQRMLTLEKSANELLTIENADLRAEVAELTELLALLKKAKFS